MDITKRQPNPDFVLNQPIYKGATILLARKNFGCGSSREHAPWALQQYGFKAVIAPSFGDIFYNNCFKNGFLPIVLLDFQIDHLFRRSRRIRDSGSRSTCPRRRSPPQAGKPYALRHRCHPARSPS